MTIESYEYHQDEHDIKYVINVFNTFMAVGAYSYIWHVIMTDKSLVIYYKPKP